MSNLQSKVPLLLQRLFFLSMIFWACKELPNNDKGNPLESTGADATQQLTVDTLGRHLNSLGDAAIWKGDYESALRYYEQSIEASISQGDSTQICDSRMDLAGVYERMGEPLKSIDLTKEVLQIYIQHNDSARIGRAYSTLAAFYGAAGMIKESRETIRKALPILEKHGSTIERCAAMNQLAFSYSDIGQWAEAQPILDSALVLMEESGQWSYLAGLSLNLGDCYRNMGLWASALHYLESAMLVADSLGQSHIKARAIERVSQIKEATGDYQTALAMYRTSKAIKDSIYNAEKVRTINEMLIKFETKEKEQQIKLLEVSNENAQNARKFFYLLIAFLLLAGTSVSFFFWQKTRVQKLRLAENIESLHALTQLLLEKNMVIKEQIAVIANLSDSPDALGLLLESTYENRILTKEDWVRFKSNFGKVYPGLALRLHEQFPGISEAEERLFLFLKLNISSSDTATLLGVSYDSVKKTRHRLRKRLNLTREEGLEDFIFNFK
jgi:tetratricopeptide (TPR) repeat protein